MKLRCRPEKKSARIEIIPLIDIMFFLLATFVMVSSAMIKNKGIALQLPTAATGTQEERKDYVSLSINEAGLYFLDSEAVSREDLEARLRQLKGDNSDPKVFLNGDARTNLQSLVGALDVVRGVGITKIAIETKE